MRSVAALQTCLGMLLALFLAPFEHIHAHNGPDHDHAGLIHAHLYRLNFNQVNNVAAPARDLHGPVLTDDDDDDHATAQSVDTFTLVIPPVLAAFLPQRGPII